MRPGFLNRLFANKSFQKTKLRPNAVSVIAAATENNNDSKNDYPCAVIIEKVAKAVVIHSMFLRSMFAILNRSFTYYAKAKKCDTKKVGHVPDLKLFFSNSLCKRISLVIKERKLFEEDDVVSACRFTLCEYGRFSHDDTACLLYEVLK